MPSAVAYSRALAAGPGTAKVLVYTGQAVSPAGRPWVIQAALHLSFRGHCIKKAAAAYIVILIPVFIL